MGKQYGFESIKNVRSGKGVLFGCDLTKTSANLITSTAGRLKFGIVAADITAKNGQQLNEGGAEVNTSSVTLNTSALLEGTYGIFYKTDNTLSTVAEAETAITAGPMVNINVTGMASSPTAMTIGSPSVQLGSFTLTGLAGTAATATVTIAGTIRTTDVVTVTIGGTAVSFTITASETTATLVAVAVKNAINANSAAALLVTATNTAGVITLTAPKGTPGNATTLAAAVSGSGATTTAVASAGLLAGGTCDIDATTLTYNTRETA